MPYQKRSKLRAKWKNRIDRWLAEGALECLLPARWARCLSGFTTLEQLTAEQAAAGPVCTHARRARLGRQVGVRLVQGRSDGAGKAPGSASCLLEPGGESLVWINGKVAGSIGWAHKEITLAGAPGETMRF
jgi:alpha-mannosidase